MDTILHIKAQDLDHAFVDDLKKKHAQASVEIRVHDIPGAAGMLGESEFWEMIRQLNWASADNEQTIEPVIDSLSKMSIANIYQFQDILSEKLWQLDTRAHARAFTHGDEEAYLSGDDFLYARCGVVANGKEYYELVLSNPQEMPDGITFSPILRIAKKAYERKTGKKMSIAPAFNYETLSNKLGWQ